MSVILKTPSNGSVTITPENTASNVILNVPAVAGSFVTADASGNVGIGTSSPTFKLDVNGDARLSNSRFTTNALEIAPYASGDRASLIDFHSSGLPDANDYSARIIRGSGVNGVLGIENKGAGYIGFTGDNVAEVRFGSAGISSRGIVGRNGVNGTSNGNIINLFWSGSSLQAWIDATNVGNVSLVSDYRIKQKITTQTTNALDRVMQLRPVLYELQDYKNMFKADGIQREGFIAHELAEIIPSAVEGKKDDETQIQSLKLDALVSVLTKAIQELKAEVDALKTQING